MDADELARLVEQGASDPYIAARMGVSARTVLRWRRKLGLRSYYYDSLPKPAHGTPARYGNPHRCRCPECRRANRENQKLYREFAQRVTRADQQPARPWTPEEDAYLLDTSHGTLVQRALTLGRSWSSCANRRGRLRSRE